jgi:hypothetical protein
VSRKRSSLPRKRSWSVAPLRKAALHGLGGKCVRCGFSDTRALQIDHVKGGGKYQSKLMGRAVYYRYVLAHLQDGEYQLLCANCNWIKRAENNEVAKRIIPPKIERMKVAPRVPFAAFWGGVESLAPVASTRPHAPWKVTDDWPERIRYLRGEGLSYEQVRLRLAGDGFNLSVSTVWKYGREVSA